MNGTIFKGIFTALVTPFSQGGQSVDMKAFTALVERQIAQGIHGLVPCGTTGETPTLNYEEYQALIKRCVEIADGQVPVIAGAGSNITHKSAAMADYARQVGADGVLVVTPYYNKPTQEGIYTHCRAVAEAAQIPTFVYNIPGRCIVNIEPATLRRLAELPLITGIKDSTGDLTRPTQTRLSCGADFIQLSGEDATIPAFLAQGGHGAISVSSNIAPAAYAGLYDAWMAGDMAHFTILRDRLHPLADAMFLESSPAPVKFALSHLGLCADSLRLPLLACSAANRPHIGAVLAQIGDLMDNTASHNITPLQDISHGG